MSITIADCMKLTAFNGANVIAGAGGLTRTVDDVSVLEYAFSSALSQEVLIGNELIITGFISVKDNLEEQLKVVKALSQYGCSGIVIYYVGIFLKEIDKSIIDLANELCFPIVCMPRDRIDYRYCEAINQIYELIFISRIKSVYFVSNIIDRVSHLNKSQITIHNLLMMLSEQLKCSLILVNDANEQIGYFNAKNTAQVCNNDIFNVINPQLNTISNRITGIKLQYDQSSIYASMIAITLDNYKQVKLVALEASGFIRESDLKQAAEVIRLFLSIWKYNIPHENKEALIPAILQNEPNRIKRIARMTHFDVQSLNAIWIIKDNYKKRDANCLIDTANKQMLMTRMLLDEYKITSTVNVYEENIIALIHDNLEAEYDNYIVQQLVEKLSNENEGVTVAALKNVDKIVDFRDLYLTFEALFGKIRIVYPHKRVISEHDVQFIKRCVDIIGQGKNAIEQATQLLDLLSYYDDEDELTETLATYLLDTQKSMEITGKLLFVHKNTVRYRIDKIKKRLGYDINQMPMLYELYTAVALKRLIDIYN